MFTASDLLSGYPLTSLSSGLYVWCLMQMWQGPTVSNDDMKCPLCILAILVGHRRVSGYAFADF